MTPLSHRQREREYTGRLCGGSVQGAKNGLRVKANYYDAGQRNKTVGLSKSGHEEKGPGWR